MVAGQTEYDLPDDIYAHKIRKLVYSNSTSKTYTIYRVRGKEVFEDIALTERFSSTEFYRYIIKNSTAGAPKIYFVPTIRESDEGANLVRIWYIRNANRLENDTDVCDIPEFVHFVIAYAKQKCMEKEGTPILPFGENQVEKQRRLMIDTLKAMVPDGDTEIEPDFSHYEETN